MILKGIYEAKGLFNKDTIIASWKWSFMQLSGIYWVPNHTSKPFHTSYIFNYSLWVLWELQIMDKTKMLYVPDQTFKMEKYRLVCLHTVGKPPFDQEYIVVQTLESDILLWVLSSFGKKSVSPLSFFYLTISQHWLSGIFHQQKHSLWEFLIH